MTRFSRLRADRPPRPLHALLLRHPSRSPAALPPPVLDLLLYSRHCSRGHVSCVCTARGGRRCGDSGAAVACEPVWVSALAWAAISYTFVGTSFLEGLLVPPLVAVALADPAESV